MVLIFSRNHWVRLFDTQLIWGMNGLMRAALHHTCISIRILLLFWLIISAIHVHTLIIKLINLFFSFFLSFIWMCLHSHRFINARRRIVQPMIDQSNRAGKSSPPTLTNHIPDPDADQASSSTDLPHPSACFVSIFFLAGSFLLYDLNTRGSWRKNMMMLKDEGREKTKNKILNQWMQSLVSESKKGEGETESASSLEGTDRKLRAVWLIGSSHNFLFLLLSIAAPSLHPPFQIT